MNPFKITLSFLFIIAVTSCLTGQTLIGINGGLNWSTLYSKASDGKNEDTKYNGYTSYCFKLDIKGRKPKPFHIGASLMYYRSSFDWEAEFGGYFADGKKHSL